MNRNSIANLKFSLILSALISFINFSEIVGSSEGGGVVVGDTGGGAGVGLLIPKCPMIIPIARPKLAKTALTIAILDDDHDIVLKM